MFSFLCFSKHDALYILLLLNLTLWLLNNVWNEWLYIGFSQWVSLFQKSILINMGSWHIRALPLISPHHPFKTIHNDLSLNIHIYLKLIENLKLILNCLNSLSPVFLFLHIQVLEIYLQILLTTAQPKRESELCANVELWLAEVTSTEFSENKAEDNCSFVLFFPLMLTF